MGVSVLGRRRTRRKVKKTGPHESYILDGEEKHPSNYSLKTVLGGVKKRWSGHTWSIFERKSSLLLGCLQ